MSKDIAAVAPGNARRSTIGIGDHGLDGLARLADLADPLESTLDRLAAVPSTSVPDQGTLSIANTLASLARACVSAFAPGRWIAIEEKV